MLLVRMDVKDSEFWAGLKNWQYLGSWTILDGENCAYAVDR